jgi:hypothetical protein
VTLDSKHASRATAEELARIAALVSAHATLEDVTRWALSQLPPRVFANARSAAEGGVVEGKGPGFDVFVQDEFTHDVVVPYDAAGELFLVYDAT